MKVKKYIVSTMAEALTQIKQELGPDAIILHNKQVKVGGIFGLFKKTRLEVVAALDENPLPARDNQSLSMNVIKERQAPPLLQHQADDRQQKVLQELQQLRQLVMTQSRDKSNQFAAPFDAVLSNFIEQDIHPSIAEDIVTEMENKYQNEAVKEKDLSTFVMDFMQTTVQPMIKDATFHKKVIQFVGPTGVGKTTTIAKVAAKTMLEEKKSVAFITTDTYRIAAIEQLKTYAKILDVPLEVAYTKADYMDALEKYSTYDHIFIDTAGRNYRDTSYVAELEEMITFHGDKHETYVVLSLTAKGKDNIDIFRVFYEKGIRQVIFTKLDETTTYGAMMNLILGEDAQVAYISNGQSVPDDVFAADAKSIAKLVMSRYIYE